MPLRRQKMGVREFLYTSAFIIVFAIGVGGFLYVDQSMNDRTYQQLIKRAQSMATLIEPDIVDDLTISEADLTNPSYIFLKEKLMALRDKNTDLAFIYLMAKRDNRVFFMADSEPPESEDYSPPGQEYEEVSFELFYNGWAPNEPYILEISEDRWGEWISALAPIVNASGTTVALLGIDQNAAEHRLMFIIQESLVVLATIVLLLLVSLLYSYKKREEDLAAMKADFVAMASHELRSPLTAIRWSLSALRNDTTLQPNVRDAVNDLYRRVRALIDLTSTFLLTASADHGVMRAGEMKLFNMAHVIHDAIEHAQSLSLMKKIHVNSNISGSDSIPVKGDAERIRLVFDNLLSNAVKYSPEGSTVSITYEDKRNTKLFRIQDQGIGIPKDEIKQIFTGFHRASNAQKSGAMGSGFGLYMAKKIVDFHGGTLTCESDIGKGTTFSVTLPTGM